EQEAERQPRGEAPGPDRGGADPASAAPPPSGGGAPLAVVHRYDPTASLHALSHCSRPASISAGARSCGALGIEAKRFQSSGSAASGSTGYMYIVSAIVSWNSRESR